MKSKFALILALPLLTLCPAPLLAAAPPARSGTSEAAPSFFVVTPEESSKQTQGVHIDTPKMTVPEKTASKPEVPIQVWSGPVPLAGGLWILVASMPVLASLYFAYQLLLFIQARRRRLSIRHDRDHDVSTDDQKTTQSHNKQTPNRLT